MHDQKGDASVWTPVALSSDLPKGGVLRTFVDGRDLAVWRSRSGVVRAWDNRCPHRGMRLSFGFVRGESLTCIYHGWQYGIDGVCRYIPAHPDLTPPATLCTTAFACVEGRGLIWASLAANEDAPDVAIADAEPLRSLVVNRDIVTVRSMFAQARFPITDAWTPSEGDFSTIDDGDGLMIREGVLAGGSRRLIAALQPLPGDRTAAHVLTSPSASPLLKKSLSRWLERLRWFAENPDVETRSWRPAEALGKV
ncbi:MAG: Rieske 2Fe-2S domain-containing protein [Geminicoccaceae bacterium]